jgi:hypothetical protein
MAKAVADVFEQLWANHEVDRNVMCACLQVNNTWIPINENENNNIFISTAPAAKCRNVSREYTRTVISTTDYLNNPQSNNVIKQLVQYFWEGKGSSEASVVRECCIEVERRYNRVKEILDSFINSSARSPFVS